MVETVMVIVLGVAALAFMTTYAQRAMQGHMFRSTGALGLQYDPTRGYTDTTRVSMNDSTRVVVMGSAVSANLLEGPEELPDVPTGLVPREPVGGETEMRANWTSTHDATYSSAR